MILLFFFSHALNKQVRIARKARLGRHMACAKYDKVVTKMSKWIYLTAWSRDTLSDRNFDHDDPLAYLLALAAVIFSGHEALVTQ
ncbi:MAG: hypothetical protein AAFX04_11480 [Pseudomonadota bacterium]